MLVFQILCITICGYFAAAASPAEEGYYWRDYNDVIPLDALSGGLDANGISVYIGKAVHPGYAMLPGMIERGKPGLFYEFSRKGHRTNQDVMILCTPYPERFEWVTVGDDTPLEAALSADKYAPRELISGGSNYGKPLVVGRIITEAEGAIIGKVHVENDKFYVINAGNGLHPSTFDVLVYDAYTNVISE